MTSHALELVFLAAKTTTLASGGTITVLAVRASRRTGSSALRSLALGFGLLTVGGALGGTVHLVLGLALEAGVLVQSLFSAAGFAVLIHSLYTTAERRSASVDEEPAGSRR